MRKDEAEMVPGRKSEQVEEDVTGCLSGGGPEGG